MLELLKNKKIGIWGFGITGQSVLRYIFSQTEHITIFEQKELSPDQHTLLQEYNASLFPSSDIHGFLEYNDYIIASPGIDLDPYQSYAHKYRAELDLFHAKNTKKTIAITGSAGKTSITFLLDQLLRNANKRVTTGGNIGTGVLDLLVHQNTEIYLLEVSSFQLEQSQYFAPDLAIITNLYPNHLDRHKTMDRYFQAKYRCVAHQRPDQRALLSFSLWEQCNTFASSRPTNRSFFSWAKPTDSQINQLAGTDTLFYVNDTHIVVTHNNAEEYIFSLNDLPSLSYPENWLVIISALYLLNIPLDIVQNSRHLLTLPEHRLEKVATIKGIDFYNDSKSTTNQATIAAVQALQGRPVHLFLGGLSKGVDRTPLIDFLKNRIAHVYCFGKEAKQLHSLCMDMNISSSSENTLKDAFALCTQNIRPQDQVLFSPGGASYDLFKDYEERGRIFKQMVYEFKNEV